LQNADKAINLAVEIANLVWRREAFDLTVKAGSPVSYESWQLRCGRSVKLLIFALFSGPSMLNRRKREPLQTEIEVCPFCKE
jgi:hypothetical protein